MSKFIAYDPKKHKGLPIYEVRSKSKGNLVGTYLVPVDVDPITASKTSWYYMVEVATSDKVN